MSCASLNPCESSVKILQGCTTAARCLARHTKSFTCAGHSLLLLGFLSRVISSKSARPCCLREFDSTREPCGKNIAFVRLLPCQTTSLQEHSYRGVFHLQLHAIRTERHEAQNNRDGTGESCRGPRHTEVTMLYSCKALCDSLSPTILFAGCCFVQIPSRYSAKSFMFLLYVLNHLT